MEVMVAPRSRTPVFQKAPTITPSGEPFNHVFHYASAPTSPTRADTHYHHFSMPETSPGNSRDAELLDFTFDSAAWSNISTADELFEEGRIRLLHPHPSAAGFASPRDGERGRQRATSSSISGNIARESRSLSPLRDRRYFFEKASPTAAPAVGGTRKWRLKDLLLFRSASEGRATGRGSKDPLWKYTLLSSFSPFSTPTSRRKGEDSRCRSFGSTESGSGSGGSSRRRGGPGSSPHEIHYTAHRAAAEEQRKKTPLPFHPHALFGCLQFNPAIRNISKGLSGHSSRGR